jgi:aspartokinase
MLSQGTNEINVIVGVEAADFEEAVRVLYAEFVH